MHTGIHSVHRDRQKPDTAKPIHSESRQVKKGKTPGPRKHGFSFTKYLKTLQMYRGKNLHALWITVNEGTFSTLQRWPYLCSKKAFSFPSSVPPSFSHQARARNAPLSTTPGAEQGQRWLPTGSPQGAPQLTALLGSHLPLPGALSCSLTAPSGLY